jgi:eukaryotic-like serine/threonine-protein kinase
LGAALRVLKQAVMKAEKSRVIAPRVRTGPPESELVSTRLPDDLLTEHVRRVSICAAVGTALWAYGFVMDIVVTPWSLSQPIPSINAAVEVIAFVVSILMFVYVRYAPHAAPTKTNAGLAYYVLNAAAVAVINTWSRTASDAAIGQVSWNAIVILVASMILPATPMRMLGASLIAASMDPLGVWTAHLRGAASTSIARTLVLFMPNYACAIIAMLPSRVLYRMGNQLRHARDMGSYRLVELLGRGGMGEVWRAEHRLLARDAAIKIVRPELLGASTEADAKSMLRRFEREAQATAALTSPHTIQVFDFGATDDHSFYYVMELLAGRDLDSLVKEFGPVPARRALYLLRQACHSIADAHARGLIHRDVTPANIYVCRMGRDYDFVKVLDFGLVKVNTPTEQHTLTGAHVTTGTPAFMAPEAIVDQDAVDERADVYALGCVAYFLLTGQLVFQADTPMKMFLQHLQAQPVPPSHRTEMPIPAELDALVLACLEKDPDRRPQDAEQLLEMLDRCHVRENWDNAAARAWWEKHLLDLAGPLTLADPAERLSDGRSHGADVISPCSESTRSNGASVSPGRGASRSGSMRPSSSRLPDRSLAAAPQPAAPCVS